MKLFAVLSLAATLGMSWQCGAFAADEMHVIERAELARTLDPALVADLDARPALAARAALALGRTKQQGAAAPLRAHLAARVPGVRAMCAYALGLLADRTSLDALRALARGDANSAVRYAAIDAVGRILIANPELATMPVAIDTFIVVRADRDATVRAHAAAQLDAFRSAPFANVLAPQLERAITLERDANVRWHIAWALYRGYATLADEKFLAGALHDREDSRRVRTRAAPPRARRFHAHEFVRTALDDPSWRVQFEAREALKRIAKRPPTEHLIADPPGIHLPPVPAVTGTLTMSYSRFAEPRMRRAAPEPDTLELPDAVVPERASDLNAPRPGPHPRVRIATTKGDVVVRLYPEWAPATVANFLALTAHGYFNGDRWFRIVPDFVVQTGDPTDTGDGDAGYMIAAEENPVEQRTGVIAMGLNYQGTSAIRDSAGTQFYVTLSPQLHLDRDFSVFGEIQSGSGVLAHLIESDRMTTVTRISDG